MGDFVGSQRAGTRGGQLESLDGEGEVLVAGVVDQEPVISRAHVTQVEVVHYTIILANTQNKCCFSSFVFVGLKLFRFIWTDAGL